MVHTIHCHIIFIMKNYVSERSERNGSRFVIVILLNAVLILGNRSLCPFGFCALFLYLRTSTLLIFLKDLNHNFPRKYICNQEPHLFFVNKLHISLMKRIFIKSILLQYVSATHRWRGRVVKGTDCSSVVLCTPEFESDIFTIFFPRFVLF